MTSVGTPDWPHEREGEAPAEPLLVAGPDPPQRLGGSLALPAAALLTPRGRGAVATVRVDGDCAAVDAAGVFRAANGKALRDQPVGRIVFGRWGGELGEEVVVCRVEAASVEVHCHGGDAAARRILDDLAAAGCVVEPWREMVVARDGTFASEWIAALARTTTLRTAEILLEQRTAWPAAIERLLDVLRRSDRAVVAALEELLRWTDFGLHLTTPWRVVLAGRPNVGKSSLINALAGFTRSIVFDQPGTTRDVVTAETALEGWPVRLIDTAGLRSTADELEAAGIERTRLELERADCRLVLFDTSELPEAEDRRLLDEMSGADGLGKPSHILGKPSHALVVAHKSDLTDRWGEAVPCEAIRVSSLTGAGLDALMQRIVLRLVPEVPPPGTAIPLTERQVELLRRARVAVEAGDGDACRAAIDGILDDGMNGTDGLRKPSHNLGIPSRPSREPLHKEGG